MVLGALLHDVGKPAATKWEFKKGRMVITSVFHDSKGIKIADQILTQLKVETRKHFFLKKIIKKLVKNHHRIYELYRNREKIGFKAISRLVKELDGNDLLLVLLDFADRQSRESDPLSFTELDTLSKWYLKTKNEFDINKETIRPIVMGKDLIELGVPPGKEMGKILKKLYDLQLDGIFRTKKEGLKLFENLKKQDQ